MKDKTNQQQPREIGRAFLKSTGAVVVGLCLTATVGNIGCLQSAPASAPYAIENSTDSTPPATISYFVTAYPTSKSITLVWRAPGDDGNKGWASQYDLRYSTSPITSFNWASARQVAGVPKPQPAGSAETCTVFDLSASTTYYFAIKAADEVPNWSGLSRAATGVTTQPSDTTPPAAIANLAVSSKSKTAKSLTLTWTAPGDDGNTGVASRFIPYDLRYSSSPITDANWASATQVTGEPTAQKSGSSETFLVARLSPSTKYYFAIRTADEEPNWSRLSNLASDTTLAPSDMVPPAAITNLATTHATPTSIKLIWTAPGDDGNTGTAKQYEIRYSASPIAKESGWASALRVPHPHPFWRKLAPKAAGSIESYIAHGLSPGNHYYFAIKTADEVPNWSDLSNAAGGTTLPPVTPTKKQLLFHEGAVFPNAQLAPIKPPYFITWFAGGGEQPHETVICGSIKYVRPAWHRNMISLGKLPLPFTYAARDRDTNSPYRTQETMYALYKSTAEQGYYGMDIDEYTAHDSDPRAQKSINAIRQLKQQYPDFFVGAAYFGDGFDEVLAGGADVLSFYCPEMYIYPGTDYRDKIMRYVHWIKYYGLEGKNIAILDGRDAATGLPDEIDLRIKYLRALSPQMAGLGVQIFKLYRSSPEERAKYDAVMYDAFFKPSPSVQVVSPAANASVTGLVKISASAAPSPETDSPIVSYRYFIDNKCVKIAPSTEYVWNTAGYSAGSHVITVHAVAEDYLVGVAQVNVAIP